jgi:hypothetical protein
MLWYTCLIKHAKTLLRTKDCCTHFIETWRTNRLLSLDTMRTYRKRLLRCRRNDFTELLPSNKKRIHIPTDSYFIRHGLHRKRRVQQFFYCGVYTLPQGCIFRTFAYQRKNGYNLLNRFVATIEGIHTQTVTHTHTDTHRHRERETQTQTHTDRRSLWSRSWGWTRLPWGTNQVS